MQPITTTLEGETPPVPYEEERNRNVAENNRRLEELLGPQGSFLIQYGVVSDLVVFLAM